MSEAVAPETFDVPAIGLVARDARFGWYASKRIQVSVLGEASCVFFLRNYAEDRHQADFSVAVSNFLSLDAAALREADEALFRYYEDCESQWLREGKGPIRSTEELWENVALGHEPMVSRRVWGDCAVYISVECECAWEKEHGLQLVFWSGLRISKLGPYDGHLANSDAFADPRLENVIYHSII